MNDYIEKLSERGLAFPDLFDEIEELRQAVRSPSCVVAFQLPFSLALDFSSYIGKGNRSDIEIHFRFIPAMTILDKRMRRTTYRKATSNVEVQSDHDPIECTQCLAAMPLWGARLEYYSRYVDLSERDRETDVVIPREKKPYSYSLSGAITVRMYELEISKRTLVETTGAVRRFLRDYMALSNHAVDIPKLVYSPIASPREERYFPLGDSPDLLVGLLSKNRNRSLRRVSKEGIARAAKWPTRGFSPFEGQILALKRLSDEGEPELALVGLMALVEWLLKENLPESTMHADKRKNGAAYLMKRAEQYISLPGEIWAKLNSARVLRNGHVHETPTTKSQSYNPAEMRYSNSTTSMAFDDAALAAFELFRAINRSPSHYTNTEEGNS